MKRIGCSLSIFLLLLSPANGSRGGRYDQEILAAVAKIVDSKSDYKDIHARVEDGIVTLTGAVKLESSSTDIEYKVRRLTHVAGVRNQITLFPPVVSDEVLFHRLYTRLKDAGYENIQLKIHNGAVVLTGSVLTERERNYAVQVVWLTDGVREVQSQLSVESY